MWLIWLGWLTVDVIQGRDVTLYGRAFLSSGWRHLSFASTSWLLWNLYIFTVEIILQFRSQSPGPEIKPKTWRRKILGNLHNRDHKQWSVARDDGSKRMCVASDCHFIRGHDVFPIWSELSYFLFSWSSVPDEACSFSASFFLPKQRESTQQKCLRR